MKRVKLFHSIVLLFVIFTGLQCKAIETSVNFSGTGVVTVDDVVMFYDDGGPSGKYTYNTTGSMTFKAPEGKSLRMSIISFYTYDDDHLIIYDGSKATGTPLADLAGYYYDDQLPEIISQSDEGALTVTFDPEKNKKYAGWEIRVEAFSASELSIEQIEVSPVNDLKLLRGSANNRMLRAKVKISGDQGKVDITGLSFNALESDTDAISAVKVWYTGEDENFGAYDLFGSAPIEENMQFEGIRSFDKPTEVYFWLTYDIAVDAYLGAKIQAKGVSVTTQTAEITIDYESTPALTTVGEGMHGIYSVGTSGEYDFSSISEAVAALASGIDGDVVLELADGNYRELVTVPSVVGASENNQIIIRSASGNSDKVVITFDTYTNPGSSNYDKRYGVFTFDGVNYLTLENVTITSGTYTGFPGIVYLRNASRHCTVKNCIISAPTSTDLAYGTSLVYMYTGNVANKNCDYFTLLDCQLDGGLIGVTLAGTSSTKFDKQCGGKIIGNTFNNQGSKGIYVSYESNAEVKDNNIVMGSEITSSYYGLDLSAFEGNLEVSGNKVLMNEPRQSAVGMYIRTYTSDAEKYKNLHIFNNTLNLTNVSSAVTGIRVNNDIPNLELIHNTVNIEPKDDAAVNAVGVFFGGSTPNGRIINNIVQNRTNGYAIQLNREEYATNSGIVFSNNNIFTLNSSGVVYLGGSGANSGILDFDKWMSLGYDVNSINEPVVFESAETLKPVQKGNLCNALPVDYIETDIVGTIRSKNNPTMGAYELSTTSGTTLIDTANSASLKYDGATLYVTGLKSPGIIDIYNIQGTKVLTAVIAQHDSSISLKELAGGLHIVKVSELATDTTVCATKILIK